jgi:hypothetical protein
MKAKISVSDFYFKFQGYGHYEVVYTSPVTKKKWGVVTSDMPLIDATKNEESPKVKHLQELKRLCKSPGR